ncbi:MAG: hypothetical protein LGB71_00395 [Sulfurovum sp.]|nr:hypothetical protein [Sulfurovum sp.]
MSIKDDVNYVKTELSSDEKILESAFKLESFYKKYKIMIWGTVIVLLLIFTIKTGMDAIYRSKLEAANKALSTLQQKADNAEARKVLKEKNPALYELFEFSQAIKKKDIAALKVLSGSKNEIISDISQYSIDAIEQKSTSSKFYKDLSYFEQAYLSIKAGDKKRAKNKLRLIDERSPLFMPAKILEHGTLKTN